MGILENAEKLLKLMRDSGLDRYTGEWLQDKSRLAAEEINVTVDYLENTGRVEVERNTDEARPFNFNSVRI
jgi:hypothetical protein